MYSYRLACSSMSMVATTIEISAHSMKTSDNEPSFSVRNSRPI